jgi:dihydroorotase
LFREFCGFCVECRAVWRRQLLRHAPRKKGIFFDIGHGGGSFAWQTAVRAFKERYYPDSLSTDLHVASMNAGMKDMTNVMSKFLALGMPLEDVIVRSTLNPAKEIKLEQLGNLSVGAPADVAVLRLETGKFGFLDQRGGRLDGTQKLADCPHNRRCAAGSFVVSKRRSMPATSC